MRIFLKEAKQVGPVSYPTSGFYEVTDEQGNEWLAAGLALPSTAGNVVIEPPAPPAQEYMPAEASQEPAPEPEPEDQIPRKRGRKSEGSND